MANFIPQITIPAAPALQQRWRPAQCAVAPVADAAAWQGTRMAPRPEDYHAIPLRQGDSLFLDFGEYGVGTLELEFELAADCQSAYYWDSPMRLQLYFGELAAETADVSPYHCTLSRGWIQDETLVFVDLPGVIRTQRRCAFRYLRLTLECLPDSVCLRLRRAEALFQNSAGFERAFPLPEAAAADPELAAIDRIGIHTLANCMQEVFEDGPKRDRRLWLGDLRLQALVNAVTFRNWQLVERCIALLVNAVDEHGILPGCVFDRESCGCRRGCMTLDYSLLFSALLRDHLQAYPERRAFVEFLLPLALHQLEMLKPEGPLISPKPFEWIFIDHDGGFDRTAPFSGVYLYALDAAAELCRRLGHPDEARRLAEDAEKRRAQVRRQFYDADCGLAFSGPDHSLSWASNIWLILGSALTPQEGRRALTQLPSLPEAHRPVSPYLYHYLLEALFRCGCGAEARALLCRYWGAMARTGAQTFFEVFAPGQSDTYTPYGDYRLNSACHAWSCTPSWFLRIQGKETPAPEAG